MRPLFLSLSSAVRSRENERERGWELETEQTQLLFARKWTVWLTGRSIPPIFFINRDISWIKNFISIKHIQSIPSPQWAINLMILSRLRTTELVGVAARVGVAGIHSPSVGDGIRGSAGKEETPLGTIQGNAEIELASLPLGASS